MVRSFWVNFIKNLLMMISFFFSDNVNEYLKLAASADKQQLQRIKVRYTELENSSFLEQNRTELEKN